MERLKIYKMSPGGDGHQALAAPNRDIAVKSKGKRQSTRAGEKVQFLSISQTSYFGWSIVVYANLFLELY